jgi:hypothetical protein
MSFACAAACPSQAASVGGPVSGFRVALSRVDAGLAAASVAPDLERGLVFQVGRRVASACCGGWETLWIIFFIII